VKMATVTYSPLLALFAIAPGLRRAAGGTLSVVVPAREEGYDARYYDIVFGDLRHRYRERLGERELEILARELPRLRSLVARERPARCRAIAAYGEASTGLCEAVALPMPSAERLEVGDPLLAPVLRQLEAWPPALVAVVDKERARTFGVILDSIVTLSDVEGVSVRHSKAGGTSATGNQRRSDNRARANLKAAAGLIEAELGAGVYPELYIAGPEEARAQLESLLPEPARRLLAGRLSASLDSSFLESDVRREVARLRGA
jgi:Bacterial archaeo-eukaryotic release factor family 10